MVQERHADPSQQRAKVIPSRSKGKGRKDCTIVASHQSRLSAIIGKDQEKLETGQDMSMYTNNCEGTCPSSDTVFPEGVKNEIGNMLQLEIKWYYMPQLEIVWGIYFGKKVYYV